MCEITEKRDQTETEQARAVVVNAAWAVIEAVDYSQRLDDDSYRDSEKVEARKAVGERVRAYREALGNLALAVLREEARIPKAGA